MRQISDSLFEYHSKEYPMLPVQQHAQLTSYRLDPTIFDISLLATHHNVCPTAEAIILIGPSFLSILLYAAQFKTHYRTTPMQIMIMDINPFVLDCWHALQTTVSACINGTIAENNTDFFRYFLSIVQEKLQSIAQQNFNVISTLDSSVLNMMTESVRTVLDSYPLSLLHELLTNTVLFCADLTEKQNADTISSLLNHHPGAVGISYASNVFEITYALGFRKYKTENQSNMQFMQSMAEKFTALFQPAYQLSVHLYTHRRDKEIGTRQYDDIHPNAIFITDADPMSIKRILCEQADVVHLTRRQSEQSQLALPPTTISLKSIFAHKKNPPLSKKKEVIISAETAHPF